MIKASISVQFFVELFPRKCYGTHAALWSSFFLSVCRRRERRISFAIRRRKHSLALSWDDRNLLGRLIAILIKRSIIHWQGTDMARIKWVAKSPARRRNGRWERKSIDTSSFDVASILLWERELRDAHRVHLFPNALSHWQMSVLSLFSIFSRDPVHLEVIHRILISQSKLSLFIFISSPNALVTFVDDISQRNESISTDKYHWKRAFSSWPSIWIGSLLLCLNRMKSLSIPFVFFFEARHDQQPRRPERFLIRAFINSSSSCMINISASAMNVLRRLRHVIHDLIVVNDTHWWREKKREKKRETHCLFFLSVCLCVCNFFFSFFFFWINYCTNIYIWVYINRTFFLSALCWTNLPFAHVRRRSGQLKHGTAQTLLQREQATEFPFFSLSLLLLLRLSGQQHKRFLSFLPFLLCFSVPFPFQSTDLHQSSRRHTHAVFPCCC